MKKLVKLIVLAILSIVVIWGGIKYKEYKGFQREMVEIVHSKGVEKLIKDDLKRLDPQALTSTGKIETYAFDDKSIRHNPMGGIMFDVFVNDDPKNVLGFGIRKYSQDGPIEISTIVLSNKFQKLIGE